VLSFTQAALVAMVSGGFTRDLQALPGHLSASVGFTWASGGIAWVAYPLDLAVAWAPAGSGGR